MSQETNTFEAGADGGRSTLLGEFWEFLRHSKKWWLTPILVLMLLVAALIVLGGTGFAPFIYTLF